MERPGDHRVARWAVPIAALGAEFLILSVAVELPTSGPASGFGHALRTLIPVLLGGGVVAWLVARPPAGNAGVAVRRVELPPWRPLPMLALHLAAAVVTAALAARFLRGGAPVSTGAVVACLGAFGLSAVFALASAAPLGWTARAVLGRWHVPILATALGVGVWRAAGKAEELWGMLSGVTLQGTAFLVQRFAGDVTVDLAERVIGVGPFAVEVASQCSGADGVGLVVSFQALWLAFSRAHLRIARALVLLPLGAAAALLANVVRIAVLVLVGAAGHEDLAIGGFHSKLGWLLFCGIAIGSALVAERVPWFQRPQSDLAPARSGAPASATAYLAPLLAALVAALITGILSSGGLDRAYAVRIVAPVAVLLLVRGQLPRPALRASWVAVLIAAGVSVLWIAWPAREGSSLLAELTRLEPLERWTWIAVHAAGSILVIPLVEELAFRGFFLPWLVSPEVDSVSPRAWTWPAVIVSSVAFGALHEQWVAGTLAGLAFAAARLWRGRLGDAVLAHALCNAAVAVAAVWGGRWDLWG